jgi:hypothetical protein
VKSARFRKTKVIHVLSYAEDRTNTNANIIMYTYKYIQNMFPKVGLLEDTKGRGKQEKNDSE